MRSWLLSDPTVQVSDNWEISQQPQAQLLTLLFPNKGKSTAMEVLATEHTPENGSLALENRRLTMSDRKADFVFADGSVAYCPQFDALFPQKSVAEHLQFYARVRGLDPNHDATKKHISAIVRLLGLGNHLHKLSTAISGGYKRRTCLAIAMIGYPRLMMIDECTTGTYLPVPLARDSHIILTKYIQTQDLTLVPDTWLGVF
jgi:ABC-type multidrug transport system ATPase subunit